MLSIYDFPRVFTLRFVFFENKYYVTLYLITPECMQIYYISDLRACRVRANPCLPLMFLTKFQFFSALLDMRYSVLSPSTSALSSYRSLAGQFFSSGTTWSPTHRSRALGADVIHYAALHATSSFLLFFSTPPSECVEPTKSTYFLRRWPVKGRLGFRV